VSTSTVKLICPECQRENEAERVYCHDCGARLDRTSVGARVHKESLKQTQKRVRNLFDPKALKLRLQFFRLSKFILGACALAAVIQMFLPPDIPPKPESGSLELSQINFDMEGAITRHSPAQLQYTEDQVNNHLQSALKNKQSRLDKPFLPFVRAIAQFSEGKCAITVERSINGGFSVYTTGCYSVRVGDAKPVVTSKGGSIGRLPIHPLLMDSANIIFSDVWGALDREYKLLTKMGGIEFHDKSVVLIAPVAAQ
jgi:hypothetical protein